MTRLTFAATTFCALVLSASYAVAGAPTGSWVQLFNGRDLTGWTPKFCKHEVGENFNETFRVVDGLLSVDYSSWERFDREFGHLFYRDTFSHYRLRAEYRFVGEQLSGGPGWALRNNGILIHGQTPESMRLDQEFPDSIEVQLLGGLGRGPRTTANLIMIGTKVLINSEPNRRRITNSSSKTFDGDQWVTVELEVRGDRSLKHFVNGELVMECTDLARQDGTPLTEGTICIQAETHPTQFRKIEVLPLDASDEE